MTVSETEVAAACAMLRATNYIEPSRHYLAAMLEAQQAEIERLREVLHAIDALREAAFVRGDVAYILGQMHEHIAEALATKEPK